MTTIDHDIELWESFRRGNKEAFASLFRKYYGQMFLFGSKFIGEKQLLEDAIQELFLELWQSKSQTPVYSVKAYLLKSLKYKLLKLIKANDQRRALQDPNDSYFEWSHENFIIEQQESEEKKQLMLMALAQLTNRQKEIIYLKYYQNLSYEEISDIMNINYQVARNLLYQSIKALKKIFSNAATLLIL
ncbi:MAG: sigma-70 family RNA polymerase sigma factor [Bacteroidetes bacterium]|nr:sigma-70 family RNA polymerase sigma factor [Bacteroidota bacterium]